MGPTESKLFNNIYADTEFYKKSNAPPTYTGNWIKQIKKITSDYANTRFFRVCGPTTAQISEFDSVQNLLQLPMATFLARINNKKDL
jgi:hypothetical protein